MPDDDKKPTEKKDLNRLGPDYKPGDPERNYDKWGKEARQHPLLRKNKPV